MDNIQGGNQKLWECIYEESDLVLHQCTPVGNLYAKPGNSVIILCCEFCWISKTALSLFPLSFNLIFGNKKLQGAMSGEFGGRWWWLFCFQLWTIRQDGQGGESTCIIMMNQPIYIFQDSLLKTPWKTCTVLLTVSLACEGWICTAQPHHNQVKWSTCS
jgi:hypothetical protein